MRKPSQAFASIFMLFIVTIRGTSMTPTYSDGDRLLVRSWRRGRAPRRGRVLVLDRSRPARAGARGPASGHRLLVKRLVAVPGDPVPGVVPAHAVGGLRTVPAGQVIVLGDAPDSMDSRHWGFLPLECVVGVSLLRLARATPVAAAHRSSPDSECAR
jgi:signal peptidase I